MHGEKEKEGPNTEATREKSVNESDSCDWCRRKGAWLKSQSLIGSLNTHTDPESGT